MGSVLSRKYFEKVSEFLDWFTGIGLPIICIQLGIIISPAQEAVQEMARYALHALMPGHIHFRGSAYPLPMTNPSFLVSAWVQSVHTHDAPNLPFLPGTWEDYGHQ